MVFHKLESARVSTVFESLPGSAADELKVMKLKPFIRVRIKLKEKKQVVESKENPETTVLCLVKRKDADFTGYLYDFRDSGHNNLNASQTSSSISLTLP